MNADLSFRQSLRALVMLQRFRRELAGAAIHFPRSEEMRVEEDLKLQNVLYWLRCFWQGIREKGRRGGNREREKKSGEQRFHQDFKEKRGVKAALHHFQ